MWRLETVRLGILAPVLALLAACGAGAGPATPPTPAAPVPPVATGSPSPPPPQTETVSITQFPLSYASGDRVAVGPDGAFYFGGTGGVSKYFNGTVTTTNPPDQSCTDPTTTFCPTNFAGSIVIGTSGTAYWVETTQHTLSTQQYGEILQGAGGGTATLVRPVNAYTGDLLVANNGAVWFAGHDFSGDGNQELDIYNPTSGQFSSHTYTLQTTFEKLANGPNNSVWATMVDIDNSQWFIAQFSADGAQIQTQLPIANTTGLTGLVFGPDNAFWFLDAGNNAVGRMTLSGAVTEYPIPTANSAPQNIAVGPDGRMWFTELNAAKLGSITTSGAITEYVLADGTRPQGIASTPPGYQPNGLWFVDLGRGIGKVTLSHP